MSEKACFGAGCFWHVQYTFSNLPGVIKATAGYIGGDEKKFPNPTYEQVCSDESRFAEEAEVEFDPKKIKYEELLSVFWIEDTSTLDYLGFMIKEYENKFTVYHIKPPSYDFIFPKKTHTHCYENLSREKSVC